MDLFRCVFSALVLLPGLYVIVRKPDHPDARKWAFGVVGFILGYWLR